MRTIYVSDKNLAYRNDIPRRKSVSIDFVCSGIRRNAGMGEARDRNSLRMLIECLAPFSSGH